MKDRLTDHHRRTKFFGGKNTKKNISRVPRSLHQHWHALFPGTMTPQEIAKEINRVWLDPGYRFVCVDVNHDD